MTLKRLYQTIRLCLCRGAGARGEYIRRSGREFQLYAASYTPVSRAYTHP